MHLTIPRQVKIIAGVARNEIACAAKSQLLCPASTRSNDNAESVGAIYIYAASTPTKSIASKVARFSTEPLRISGSTRKREE